MSWPFYSHFWSFFWQVHIQKFIDEQNCKVAGWGETEREIWATAGRYPEVLRQVVVPIRNTAQCEKEYRRLSQTNKSGTFDHKSFQLFMS